MPVPVAFPGQGGETTWGDISAAAVTVAIAVAGIVQASGSHRAEVAALLLIAVAPWLVGIVLRWSVPFAVHATVTLTALGVLHTGGPEWGWLDLSVDSQLTLLIAVVLVGEVAALGSRAALIGTGLGAAAVLAGRYATDEYWARSVAWPAAILLALGVGFVVRRMLQAIGDLQAAQAQLEVEAVKGERKRIAREVHDLVAHSLTVSMLHLTAARMAINRGDQTAAVEALDEAETAGRTGLRDVRRTIGLLRDGGDGTATRAPAPAAGDLVDLVESCRGARMTIDLRLSGAVDELDATTGLAVFRVVQESLANAARHLPGADNTVSVSVDMSTTEVVVESTGAVAGPQRDGHGLVGMQERVASLGGSLGAGPTPDGWRVAASIPTSQFVVSPTGP